jgi:hypothetical protein
MAMAEALLKTRFLTGEEARATISSAEAVVKRASLST